MQFHFCESVLWHVQGLLYAAVKPKKILLVYETSNGAKMRILIEMAENSHTAPEDSRVDCSHHRIMEARNNLGWKQP